VLLWSDFGKGYGVGGLVAHNEDATACHTAGDDFLSHEHADGFGSETAEDGDVWVEDNVCAFVFGLYAEDFLVPDISEEVNHANGVAAGIEKVDEFVGEDRELGVAHGFVFPFVDFCAAGGFVA